MAQASKENPFSKHTSELRDSAAAIGHNVQDLGRATRGIAQDAVDLVKNNANDYYQQGKKKAQKWEQSLEGRIRENPVKALLIAAGVGFLVGAILKKRRS
ncbi:MAG TPA: hypothetical protein DF383_06885 [Deltaproteobacteria bacterium]|nr:hypothetical protein [Deltaproteobacteria bacterium]